MANLEFTEYVRAPAIYGGQTGLLRGQANPTQQVAIGAASAVSAAFGGTTNLIEVTAVGADCRIEIGGAAVVAVNSGTFSRRLNAGHIYHFAVEGGQYLAVIAIEGGADVDEETAPAGMATAARQDTGNTALAAIQAAAGAIRTDTIYNGSTALTPKFAKIAASSSGDNTIVAAVTSKKIRVLAYHLTGNGAVNAKFQSDAGGTDLTGLAYIATAGGGLAAPFNPVGWFETAAGKLLNLNLSGGVAVGGVLAYIEV